MKKIFISIFFIFPFVANAQTVLTPQQQLEEAQKQLEAAKKAVEVAKMQAEAARLKAQADSINAETQKVLKQQQELEMKKQKLQQEQQKQQQQLELEKQKLQQELEQEQQKLQQQQQQAKEATPITPPASSNNSTWYVPEQQVKKEVKKEVAKNEQGLELKADPKYLSGAITTDANGKIVFEMTTDANGKTAAQIYDLVYAYMSELTQGEKQIGSRIALVNPNEHIIANAMNEWLVFNTSFLSVDQTEFKYTLIAEISNNKLKVTLNHISYNYEEGRQTGFRESAENVISDKLALNKKKTGLAKIFGKFRKNTIDRKDQIFSELTALVKQ